MGLGWCQSLLRALGILNTSILLEARDKEKYFRNFYARRALRIWPVYLLVLAVCYANAPWFIGPSILGRGALRALVGVSAISAESVSPRAAAGHRADMVPLAIEEQYYFVWAPVVRYLRAPALLAVVLLGAMIGCPLVRMHHFAWLTPTHTLIHLDGIALGSLLALGLYTLHLTRRVWLALGLAGLVLGLAAAATIAGGTAFLDSALAIAFAGAVLAAIASTSGAPGDRSSSPEWTGARNPMNIVLQKGPLAFYGRISYGLYMTHIAVFIFFGWFDLRMDRYGVAGNLAVVAFRLAVSTACATALWYGFESQILKLKRYF